MAYQKPPLSCDKPPSVTKEVSPRGQIEAIRRYIESGESNCQDGLMTVAIARATVRKATARGINVNGLNEEIDSLEIPAYMRYLKDGIIKLEEHKTNKTHIDPKRLAGLEQLVGARLKALEARGIQVSDLRDRFDSVMRLK